MPSKPAVRILAEYPMPVIYGGLEIVCERTYEALRKTSLDVEMMDYSNPDQKFDILSIFGNPPSMYEIAVHAAKSKKVVFSAVFGGAVLSPVQSAAVKSFSWFVERFGQKIDHTRVRDMFQAAHHLAVLNEIEQAFIAERYDISPSKMTIVPVGVDDRFFDASPKQFISTYGREGYVLFTGNIIPRKNPIRLARALTELGLKGVFIGKEVAGHNRYAEEFSEVVESDVNLLWIKGLRADDPLIPSACKAAAAFCLPSFAEGQSGSSLEAMAAGIPLILADLPYSYQHCYEKCERCDPMSVESIKQSIVRVLDKPDRYRPVISEKHRYASIALQMEHIYHAVVNC
jgi:glycosyltransferase involved in cell wall biosynthesis